MYKSIAGSLVAAALLLPAPADALKQVQNIDFSTINCQTFLADLANGSEDDAAAMMLWLDGYLSGVSGDTVLRFDGLGTFGENLVEHCASNGNDRLLDAARKVGLE